MHYSINTTRKLAELYKEISVLGKIRGLLEWDLNVNLPEKGTQARADQVAFLASITTDKWLDARLRTLLEKAESRKAKLTKEEQAAIRNLIWGGKYYFKVPKGIIVEMSRSTSEAFMAWQKAYKEDNFKQFLPYLEKLVKLNQDTAEHLGYKDNPYDALLDLYEQGFTEKQGEEIFKYLVPKLTRLLKQIQKKGQIDIASRYTGKSCYYSPKRQKQLGLFILRKMGYDLKSGRMDVSAHPFTLGLSQGDVRITNRYKKNEFVESIMVAMHEGGHALYEQGVDKAYEDTPLASGVSLGIHESQSRFWENQIGRSEPFLRYLTPVLQAFYPDSLSDIREGEVVKLFNTVKPSFIRVEADEVTYNLHIALRFDLENKLINNKLKAKDLPEAWRQKMKKLLGIVPKTDKEGVLQDVHWSYGSFGYFPTYTLGNLYAAQFTKLMQKELDISDLSKKGDLGTILAWQREHIHRHGSLYWPGELVERVTGEKLNPKYLVEYLEEKYKKIYGLNS